MSEPHTFFDATITDPWDGTETVYAGSLPTWAAKDPDALRRWKYGVRQALIGYRTSDSRGWRVKFTMTHQDEGAPDNEPGPQTTPTDPAGVTG